jgi:S1-C subfamily serine protease
MNRILHRIGFLALLALPALIGGCTYNGQLESSFYTPSQHDDLYGKKFPMSIAVIEGPRLKNATFSASAGGHAVEIPLGDPLCGAIESELRNIFVKTAIVDDAKKGKFDLYVYPEIDWVEVYRDTSHGVLGYRVKFQAQVRDVRNHYTVHKFATEKAVLYTPPPEALGAQAVMGASLFLLAPVTIPITTQAVGEKAKELIGGTITEIVHEFGNSLAEDGAIRDVAAINAPAPDTGAASAAPARASVAKRRKSKYDALLDAVVKIRTADGFGSGFFITGNGLIVTNRHVVGDERTVSVKTRDGAVTLGQVTARDSEDDLALVRVQGRHDAFLRLSNGEDAGIGNDVIAIGTPEGLDWSVTRGIVSALRSDRIGHLIQTDAAINHGNSGGPLIDLSSGLVIGVNTLGVRKDIAEGLNFAVSSEDVLRRFGTQITTTP